MKNEKGVTLIIAIMTVILLTIIVGLVVTNGVGTFKRSKVVSFETNMKLIQKKLDVIVEEEMDYTKLGTPLTNEQKTKLQTIISNDTNGYIKTKDVSEDSLRYFSSIHIEAIFDISDVNDEFIINFSNREVISLKGVEKDNVMHYVINGL